VKNGRAKGKIAEREVCRLLEAWWGQLETGCKFKPTPMSGGWSSPDVREAFHTSGDLVTTAEKFPFCIEVKRRESFSWENLTAGKASPVLGWWDQAVRQAAEMGSCPMLVFRRNREPWWVVLPYGYVFAHANLIHANLETFLINNGFETAARLDLLLRLPPEQFARPAR
jgi:hypothetical protein